jgi:predicted transcriptional regulator
MKKKRVIRKPQRIAGSPVRKPVVDVPSSEARWTFLTNHSHVLILLAQHPTLVLREVAVQVGITERAVQRIILDLENAGFLVREKVGRQNHYRIRTNLALRHPIEAHRTIGDLVGLI